MPNLIAAYVVHSGAANTVDLVTPSFTPANGEVLVAKVATWDTNSPNGATSGGGLTWTVRQTAAPSGFFSYGRIDTAVVSGSPGPMTVTSASTAGNSRHSMVVERWANAKLAASPAVNSPISGSGLPTFDVTTTAAGSVITWASGDTFSRDPSGRAYLLSAVEDGIFDGSAGGNGVFYFAYALVGSAGTYTGGMTAPGSQGWNAAAIEVLDDTPGVAVPPPLVVNQAAIIRAGRW